MELASDALVAAEKERQEREKDRQERERERTCKYSNE
jgi:hypothetical protein